MAWHRLGRHQRRQMAAYQRPGFRGVKAGLRLIVHQGKRESALQRDFAAAELVHDEGEIAGMK